MGTFATRIIAAVFAAGLLLLMTASCTREMNQPASISIRINSTVQSKSVSALSLTLKRLMINVSSPGLPPVVYIRDKDESGSAVPTDVSMDVPSGPNQLVQVLAAYDNDSSGGMTFYYADQTLTLNPGSNEISMTLTSLGTSSGVEGRIVGRYALPGPVYPTDKLEVVYDPGNGRQPMLVDQGEIVGGWFNLFLLDDIALTYRFRDSKKPLAFTTGYAAGVRTEKTNVKLSDFSAVTGGGGFPGIGVLNMSSYTAMYRNFDSSGPGTFEHVTPFKAIYGYHGSSDLPWASLSVTFKDSSTTNFTTMRSLAKQAADPNCTSVSILPSVAVGDVTGSTIYETNSNCAIDVTSVPYLSSVSGAVTNASPMSAWLGTDNLAVGIHMLDGQGNDSLAPFRGILRVQDASTLSYVAQYLGSSCSSGCNHPFDFELVSGVDSVIDVIKIYKSTTVSIDDARGHDFPDCAKIAANTGFSLIKTIDVSSGVTSYTSNSVPFTAADVTASYPVAICPVDANGNFMPGGVVFESERFFY